MSNGVVVAAMAFVLIATVAYGCSDDDRDVCAICREDLHACPMVTTTCKHAFHSHCLQAWFDHLSSTGDLHHRCPLCHRVLQYVRPQRPRPAPGISGRLLRLFCRSADAVILTLLGTGKTISIHDDLRDIANLVLITRRPSHIPDGVCPAGCWMTLSTDT